jgi:hypothetical protein
MHRFCERQERAVKSSPLRASEIEALTFIYSPNQSSPEGGAAPRTHPTSRTLAGPLLGAAVALVALVTLAWILTPR